jgi:hypothetical protein
MRSGQGEEEVASGDCTIVMSRRRSGRRSQFVLAQNADAGLKADSGFLPVSCWCERRLVAVGLADIRAGLTRSCGDPSCVRAASST